ncbi:MAG TPA: cupin domain-containing protein [Thermoleophilaceae bacterium]|jgi:quercetin dioxygenase-like cupin family protein
MYFVLKADAIELAEQPALAGRAEGLKRATLVGRPQGAVHTGFALVTIEPGGWVGTHVHSTEQSFFVLRGNPEITLDGRTYRMAPDECGFIPVGTPHSWRAPADGEAPLFLEMNSPSPRLPDASQPDTFWTGEPVPEGPGASPDIRDPRSLRFFRLRDSDMDLDKLKVGDAIDAPTVSGSMASALLAYSGIAVKMLVDSRLGAVLHTMFMVQYQPSGVVPPHDHPLEETYYMLDGEVEATADGDTFMLGPGDVFWTSVGCVHSFLNKSDVTVRWLETQAPQPPANHSYRFNRDWDYLAERLGE